MSWGKCRRKNVYVVLSEVTCVPPQKFLHFFVKQIYTIHIIAQLYRLSECSLACGR